MSAPFSDGFLAVPTAVLIASLLGSGHCVAMCGGLVLAAGKTRSALFAYHAGRLIAYVALGGLAGWAGRIAFDSPVFAVLPWISTALLGGGFVWMGVNLWLGRAPHLFRFPSGAANAAIRLSSPVGRALAMGLCTAMLPCGWLHTFVWAAAATRSPALGALSLAVFWLGTVPALSAAPLAIHRALGPLACRAPRLSALVLIVLGLGTVAAKMIPRAGPDGTASCHHGQAPMAIVRPGGIE